MAKMEIIIWKRVSGNIVIMTISLTMIMMMMMMMMMMTTTTKTTTMTTTTTMMMMILITATIIMITLSGAIRYFYNLLTALRTVSNEHAQLAKSPLCVNDVQHFRRVSRATCRVPHGTKDRSETKVDRSPSAAGVTCLCPGGHSQVTSGPHEP